MPKAYTDSSLLELILLLFNNGIYKFNMRLARFCYQFDGGESIDK